MHVGATLQLSDWDLSTSTRNNVSHRDSIPAPYFGQLRYLVPEPGRQPVDRDADGGGQRRAGQPVISAGHLMNRDPGGELVRSAKRVPRPLEDQQRDADLEFGGSRLLRMSRRVQGESERKDANGAGRTRRPAGHPGTTATAADRHAQSGPLGPKQPAQVLDYGRPRDVELRCGRRRASAGHQIRLPHPGDRDSGIDCGGRHRAQIRRLDAAARSVSEH
jgi:hypothetical protein